MKLGSLLSLPPLLLTWAFSQASALEHSYNERLELTPLRNHHLHADFIFNATTPLSAYEAHHYRYFPRSLAQILQATHTSELHLRFALGRWDDQEWGQRPRGGRREGGTGVEIWAWLQGEEQSEIEERWTTLVNSLSGLFCASLNFIDGTKTTSPVLIFEPEGTLTKTNATTRLMHGLLPREVICTENLTPFLKLLPCKGKAGISSLLDGHKLFDSTWQSMSIDVRTVCPRNEECGLEIEQGISMALSIPRSMRDRHNPIPRPIPIGEIECDQSKPWNSHDSCFPKAYDGEMAWTLSSIFDRPLRGSCDLTTSQDWPVYLRTTHERTIEASGASSIVNMPETRRFQLMRNTDFDLNATEQKLGVVPPTTSPALYVSRQMTGHGQERGGMQTVMHNPHPYSQRIVFFESLPWFLRPFMHTLTVEGANIEQMLYTPLIDRKRGTHLELLLDVPPQSTVVLKYDVEKAILRYTEYPPDANRGFDIGAAVVRVLPSGPGKKDQYLRTTSLLLPLPTPDFSMPYNVIILTSTVIALGFGSIFTLLTRRFVLLEEVPDSPLRQRLTAVLQLIRQKILKQERHDESIKMKETSSIKDIPNTSSPTNGSTSIRQRKAI